MRRICLMLFAYCVVGSPLAAQTPEEEVVAVLHRLFDAMHAKDSAAILTVMDTSAALVRMARGPDGTPVVGRTPAYQFASRIANLPAEREIEERFWDPVVQIDGTLATVWTQFVFLVDGTISHCGVDAFELMRFPDGWRITHVADTIRREGCEIPAH